jgi:homoserine dehydrogenase
MAELRTRYYLRLTVADQPGVLAQISHILGESGISISSVLQKEAHEDAQTAELVIMTHIAREASMQKAMALLNNLDVVQEIGNFLRVEQQ